jgi:hypothetical protein
MEHDAWTGVEHVEYDEGDSKGHGAASHWQGRVHDAVSGLQLGHSYACMALTSGTPGERYAGR